MLELLSGYPDDTVAVRAHGVIEPEDYTGVLIPAFDAARQHAEHVNVLMVIGPEFESYSAGALWDDAKFGAGHMTGWGRIALVSDHEWARWAVGVGKVFMPGHLRHFPLAALDEARGWVARTPA